MENKNQRKGRSSKKKSGKQNPARDKGDPTAEPCTERATELEGDDDLPSRTPVHIPPSPGSSTHVTGPLQGSARVVKDHCADWHNYMQKWDTLNDKGFVVANKISNLILQSRETEEAEKATMKTTGLDGSSEGGGTMGGMPDGLEQLCNEFTEIHNGMVKLVAKMSNITEHFKGICNLEMQTSSSTENNTPLFKTWPVEYFYENSMELEDMYCKELKVKRTVVQDIAHQTNRDVLMTYMSTWQHQPYIEDKATTLLESMLHESGHR
ncbi:cyclin-dependent kinase 2-interacting protein-like [Amphiura filiformis]|uniref:cyclin-dependent kinase 2-interacting protein-like n=1 Tax=Amphiura filiformis TaxID=82378 RepID=UPI003B226566